jgi:hypothetical protein
MKRYFLLAFCVSVLTQCAFRYKPILPETVEYDVVGENDDLRFAYRYDVFKYRKNKLAKYEDDIGARIVAVQITNKTSRPLNITRDLDLYTDAGEYPYQMANQVAAKRLSQPVATYLLYSLVFYADVECQAPGQNCHFMKVKPFGVGIAAINMVIAGRANRALKKEFKQYDIENLDIAPGQTVYGIMSLEVEDPGHPHLKLDLR